MSFKLNDVQIEAIGVMLDSSEKLKTRGGTNVSISWETYSEMAKIVNRFNEIFKVKFFKDKEQFNKDLSVLINMAEKCRLSGKFSWVEGDLLYQSTLVFKHSKEEVEEEDKEDIVIEEKEDKDEN